MLSLALALLPLLSQDKPPAAAEQKALIEAYLAADWRSEAGLAERRRILARLDTVALTAATAAAQQKKVLDAWEKGRELAKDSRAYFWEKEQRGLYLVGGQTRKPRALAICMHGGGVGEGDASSAQGAYEEALRGLDWLAIYPEVLEKTECGWTDSGSEEFVLELVDAARRTWKLSPERVFLVGHSMGGYGSWTLGAHHADQWAGLAPSAGAPTPYLDRGTGQVVDIAAGVVPNLRNVALRIYQSDDDPRVPPDANRFAVQRLKEAQLRWGGFDFEYWEVPGRAHDAPPGGFEAHLAKLAETERTTHPDTVVWQPTLPWKWQSYWLFWETPVSEALVVARADRAKNEVRVECDKDARGLYVLVDEHLLDPKKELAVFLNGAEVFRGVPAPSLAAVVATGARGDPELAYRARVPLF